MPARIPRTTANHAAIAQIIVHLAREVASFRQESVAGGDFGPGKVAKTAQALSETIDKLEKRICEVAKPEMAGMPGEPQNERQRLLGGVRDLRQMLQAELAAFLEAETNANQARLPDPSLN